MLRGRLPAQTKQIILFTRERVSTGLVRLTAMASESSAVPRLCASSPADFPAEGNDQIAERFHNHSQPRFDNRLVRLQPVSFVLSSRPFHCPQFTPCQGGRIVSTVGVQLCIVIRGERTEQIGTAGSTIILRRRTTRGSAGEMGCPGPDRFACPRRR